MSTDLIQPYDFDKHLNDVKKYPYSCSWLWHVAQQFRLEQSLTVANAFGRYYDAQDWLNENVRTGGRDGINNYQWSNGTLVTALYRPNGDAVNFPNILRFTFQEDLLAFTIRFNMHGNNLL
jgi:hypothetical protein